MLEINSKDKRINDIAEINRICIRNNRPVVILGGGTYGRAIAQCLKEQGLKAPVKFTVDDEYITDEQKKAGMLPFSEYLEKFSSTTPLVFGFYNYEIIMKKREQHKNDIPYMFDFHYTVLNDIRVDWSYDYIISHIREFSETYNMLSNEESKATMQAYLNAAVAGEFHELYTKHVDKIPYFNEKLVGRRIDRLFDCGAYDGDSAHDFIAVFPEYEHIFEFEPDRANVEKINSRIKNENIRNLTIIEKGVWSETTTLSFISEGKSSSTVADEGDVSIEVIKLDDMFDKFTRNSLIKMDIEGSELEALKGAARVISEISPALTICIYHKKEDIITIPQYINSLVKPGTYDYYVGYQGLDLAEFVFYALPKIK